jgi:serine acetyltransferase
MNFLVNLLYAVRKGFNPKCAVLCDIDFRRLPESTTIMHPYAIVIGKNVVMGKRCVICQNVTIMRNCILGDNVFVGVGAIIFRDVKVGDNVKIGAGSIVLKDVPDDVTVIGVYKKRKRG